MPVRLALMLSLAVALAGCQAAGGSDAPPTPARAVTIEPEEDWRRTALPEHASIAEDLPPLFARLAAATRRSGADRDLLDPGGRLAAATPAPGAYRCRILRLPAPAQQGRRERGASRTGFCFVGADGDRLSLTIETPLRRLGGFLWPSTDPLRLVYLAAGFAPPARTAPAYGTAPGASTAGLFERIGDFRYRLVVRGPTPGTADVWELVAAPPQD